MFNIIQFQNKFDEYIELLFLYRNDNFNFIKTLKLILLLMIDNCFCKKNIICFTNLVNQNMNIFDIQDYEYRQLLCIYNFIYNQHNTNNTI
jgi:hypothetical protein